MLISVGLDHAIGEEGDRGTPHALPERRGAMAWSRGSDRRRVCGVTHTQSSKIVVHNILKSIIYVVNKKYVDRTQQN